MKHILIGANVESFMFHRSHGQDLVVIYISYNMFAMHTPTHL